jgi:S-adenosylmethionine-dependent methyltransferase
MVMTQYRGILMTDSVSDFEQVLHKWQDENTKPWGKLRYHSAWRNIAKHIEDRPLRILDIGGGDGMDAIHYANLGHSVTLSDCSSIMLSEAKKSADKQGVTERLRFIQTGSEPIPDLLHEKPFDLILCHMMIEFVPDAQSLLRNACKHLSAKGLFSVLETNRYSDVYLQAFQMKSLSGACNVVGKKEYFHPWVNRLTPRFSADEIIDQFSQYGCSLVGHYGVLSVCAYLPNEPKFDPEYYGELEKLEDSLTDRYPYYLLARFFQVIVQKN